MMGWIKKMLFYKKNYNIIELGNDQVAITIQCSERFAKDFFEELFKKTSEWERLKGTK